MQVRDNIVTWEGEVILDVSSLFSFLSNYKNYGTVSNTFGNTGTLLRQLRKEGGVKSKKMVLRTKREEKGKKKEFP